jgi:glycine/D-amino acid oxidase-like deaminating enzyme/nitrite reductase/ring-hydroxylating ferredoxin subunit
MTPRPPSSPNTEPFWSEAAFPSFPRLDEDLDVDVAVVGAGITGLTAAYLLTRAGKSVALLERGRCGQGETGHTSGHLTMVTDTPLIDLAPRFDVSHAQAVWDAGLAAIVQIATIVHEEGIECDFRWIDGYLHQPPGHDGREGIQGLEQTARLADEMGFDATFVEDVPFAGGPGVRFATQARFHPRKYLAGLARFVRERGGHIFEETQVDEVWDAPLGLQANRHFVRCRDLVVATHMPLFGVSNEKDATLLQSKLAPYTTYVVAGAAPRGSVPDALFWDTGNPYRYLRIEPREDDDLVILGGADHKTGQASDTSERFRLLEDELRAAVPGCSPTYRWSGQVLETPDGLPYLGRVGDGRYAATGFSGNGLTFGTVGAMIASDAIVERPSPWVDLFDPGRGALRRGLWTYVKENADYPYYRLRDRFAGAEGKSLRAVERGQGKVVEYRGEKVAAFRDSDGTLSIRSAVCTHMGCVVAWNDAERSWDCPCHGSRFTPGGDVIAGPARDPLPEPQSAAGHPVGSEERAE